MFKRFHSAINFSKIYFYLTMLLAFSTPLSWKFSMIVITVILIAWLFEGRYKDYYERLKDSKFIFFLLLFATYQLLTFVWTAESFSETSNYLRNYLLWLTIPILSFSLKKEQIPSIITTFLIAMAISEFVAYGMYFEFWTIKGHGSDYPSPFMHHVSYSVFMAFTAIILLNRIYSSLYGTREKLVMILFFLTITGNLFISQGRIGQLAFAIAILITGFLHFRLRIKSLLLSLILTIAIFLTAYSVSPMFEKRIYSAINDIEKIFSGNFSSSWGIRSAYIILGNEILKDHPLLGVGIGDTKIVTQAYIDANRVEFSPDVEKWLPQHGFHNQYVMTAVQSGLVGILLLGAMFYAYIRLPVSDRELKQLSLLLITIYLAGFISGAMFLSGFTNALFILFTALFTAASLSNNRL